MLCGLARSILAPLCLVQIRTKARDRPDEPDIPSKRTVFRERSSRKTMSFEEQIMSADKYPSIFTRHMEATVFIIFQISFATRAVLKIGNI